MSVRRWLPPILWAAFILVLTSIPGADLPRVSAHDADKVAHFALYGVFAYLLGRALRHAPTRRRAGVIVTVVSVSLFGALDEWHQQFIPGRSMELLDWVADTTGALAGAVAAATVVRREQRA